MTLPRPTGRACAWGAALSALFLLETVHPVFAALPFAAWFALAALCALDAALGRRGRIEVRRVLPHRFSLDRPAEVVLEVVNRTPYAVEVRATDDLSDAFDGDVAPGVHAVLPDERLSVAFSATPRRRGEHRLGPLRVRAEGPLGLSWREERFDPEDTARVYPDGGMISSYERLLLRGRTRAVGIRSVREVGAGAEFENLRDFQPGDDPRHLDWKSSARRQRLTFRNREPERQQDVLLLVDTGRLMTARWRDRERLEVSLRAAAMLAWVVSRSHDNIGIVTFSSKVHAALKPASGTAAAGRLREVLLRAASDLSEPDYREAFAVARNLLPKRALLLLFTDPVGTAMAGEIRGLFQETRRRHLNCLVTMRDPEVWARSEAPAPDADSLALRAAAEAHLQERQHALAALKSQGVLVVDAFPEGLTPGVVNRYLDLKATRRL